MGYKKNPEQLHIRTVKSDFEEFTIKRNNKRKLPVRRKGNT
jgi:hypothetical protein